MYVIGINSLKIITKSCVIIDIAEYTQYEKKLIQKLVEMNSFNSGDDLIRLI